MTLAESYSLDENTTLEVIDDFLEKKKGCNKDNLAAAKRKKDNEFYTRIQDIEAELKYYKKHFKNKIVLCNCDDPEKSNFYKYFAINFNVLGLKKLMCTHYESDSNKSYYMCLDEQVDTSQDGWIDESDSIIIPLRGNGDFRDAECVELLKQADIVVTNPPFALFRDYIAQLIQYNKKFLIIGSLMPITYKEVSPFLVNGDIWLGITTPKHFIRPDGSIKDMGNTVWYTNLTHTHQNDELLLVNSYYKNPELYHKYDNYDAIECSKVVNIPKDYIGQMGVPISFMQKYCKEQFDIIGLFKGYPECDCKKGYIGGQLTEYIENRTGKIKSWTGPTVNKKSFFARILIKYTDKWIKNHPEDFSVNNN